MVDNFQKYLETINRRYQEALKVFKPSHRQPTDIEQELALRAALDYTNNELFGQNQFGMMLEHQLSQLDSSIEAVAAATDRNAV